MLEMICKSTGEKVVALTFEMGGCGETYVLCMFDRGDGEVEYKYLLIDKLIPTPKEYNKFFRN